MQKHEFRSLKKSDLGVKASDLRWNQILYKIVRRLSNNAHSHTSVVSNSKLEFNYSHILSHQFFSSSIIEWLKLQIIKYSCFRFLPQSTVVAIYLRYWKKMFVRFSQSGGRMTTHLYRKSIIIQCKAE